MNSILTYNDINPTQWQHLVEESRTGTWFQSPAAYRLYASLPEVMQPFVVAIATDGMLRGVCVGYVTRDSNPLRQFFTRRAIIVGGPCLADDCTNNEAEHLLRAVIQSPENANPENQKPKTESPIYIETRNFNDYSLWREAFQAAGFTYRPHLNFHVDTQGFADRLSDNRKRQLKKSAASVLRAQSEDEVRAWYPVLARLYRTKVRMPLFPVEFFLQAFRQGAATFLLVRYDNRIIGGNMIVEDPKCVYEWFECGLNTQYREQYPSVLATFAGMEYAAKQGCERYDLMGAGEPGVPYGVRDFKSEFGGRLVEHGRFLAVRHPLLYRIGLTAVRFLKRKAQ
jgi:hypothetical protein